MKIHWISRKTITCILLLATSSHLQRNKNKKIKKYITRASLNDKQVSDVGQLAMILFSHALFHLDSYIDFNETTYNNLIRNGHLV